MTQCDKILRYMTEVGSITPMEAMEEFACMRLGARIFDLRKKGVPIVKETITRNNRFGEPVSFAKYSIAKGDTWHG